MNKINYILKKMHEFSEVEKRKKTTGSKNKNDKRESDTLR